MKKEFFTKIGKLFWDRGADRIFEMAEQRARKAKGDKKPTSEEVRKEVEKFLAKHSSGKCPKFRKKE